jgi:hypothetical protein
MKNYKKYLLFLAILAVLTPIGIVLPHYFKAGDAWGEWSVKTVKEQTGIEPSGMKKNASIYNAPIADYNPGKEDDSIVRQSGNYIISGLIGAGIILILTFGAIKLFSRKEK